MTANQLTYWNLQETIRSNKEREKEMNRSNLAKESENFRSNTAQEKLAWAEQARKEEDSKYSRAKMTSETFANASKGVKNIIDATNSFFK